MTKKVWILISLSIVLIVTIDLVYWFYFASPAPFLTDDHLTKEMNSNYGIEATTIQEKLFLDERHVLVPFISNKNNYSLSYWVWENHKWRVVYVDTVGQMRLWKLERNDPSSYYFVWNIHPNDHLSYSKIYLIRDRNFLMSEGDFTYYPKVQMEETIDFKEKTYGVMQLPEDWLAFMNTSMKVELESQPNLLFNNLYFGQSIYFGWIPFDEEENQAFPEHSLNGSSYSDGHIELEYLMLLDERNIETPR